MVAAALALVCASCPAVAAAAPGNGRPPAPDAVGAGLPGVRPAPGSPPRLPARSRPLRALAKTRTLQFAFVLRPRDQAALAAFATAVSTPGNALYGHYLARGEFGPRFGATRAQIRTVRKFLRSRGLTPGPTARNRLLIPVTASAAAAAKALDTDFTVYRLPSGRSAYANTAAPALPDKVAGAVQAVTGLSNVALPHPLSAPARIRAVPHGDAPAASADGHQRRSRAALTSAQGDEARAVSPAASDEPHACAQANSVAAANRLYTQDQIAHAYSLDQLWAEGLTGAGVTVGIYSLEPYKPSDIAAFQQCFGTSASVGTVTVGSGPGTGPGSGESALDIENVIGSAPGAKVMVYEASPTDALALWTRIVDDDQAKVISTSWGYCEAQQNSDAIAAESSLFQQAAAQGQEIVAASGDDGSEDCAHSETPSEELSVDDPAGQPFVTGVGGTYLSSLGPPPTETVWNDSISPQQSGPDGPLGGGGGISRYFEMPGYQYGPGVLDPSYSSPTPCNVSSGYCREVPDVSANAAISSGYLIYYDDGQPADDDLAGVAGTSAAAPLFAGLLATIEQRCAIGFANPALYQAAADPGAAPAFNDITTGDNDVNDKQNGAYPATTGYDMATGLGTPIATGLLAHLCPMIATSASLTVSPRGQSDAGQPVTLIALVGQAAGYAPPSGSVTFTDGGTPLGAACTAVPLSAAANGASASCTVSDLAPGEHSLGPSYSGGGAYEPASSPPLSYLVNPSAAEPGGGGTGSPSTPTTTTDGTSGGTGSGSSQPPSGSGAPTHTVRDPVLRARLSVTRGKRRHGWYRSPVTVTFLCTTGSAPLSSPGCPAAVKLRRSTRGRRLTRRIAATDGGSASLTVGPIRIDRRRPQVRVRGVRRRHVYRHRRHLRCAAADRLSGVASCRIRTDRHRARRRGSRVVRVHFVAIARDRAGNRTRAHGHYYVLRR